MNEDNENHAQKDKERKSQQRPPEGVEAVRDVPYMDHGGKEHLLDIFMPRDAAEHLLVIVDIHGGGWIYGDKELNEYYCMALAKLGFVVFNVNYTLVPETDLKGQIHDISAALNWIFAKAGEYHGKAEALCLTGDSAGGQLALLVCAVSSSEAYRSRYGIPALSGTIRGLGLTCPVPCLHQRVNDTEFLKRERVKLLYGPYGTKIEKSELWKYSDPEDFAAVCRFPPVWLLTTSGDRAYFWESEMLHQILLRHKVPHVYRVWEPKGEEKLGHVFSVLYPECEDSQAVNGEMAEFFRECVRSQS